MPDHVKRERSRHLNMKNKMCASVISASEALDRLLYDVLTSSFENSSFYWNRGKLVHAMFALER